MVKAKKDAPVEEGVAVADAPVSEVAEGSKKTAGRKKGTKNMPKAASELPKRTLRSNSSKATLVEPPVEKWLQSSNDGKKASKPSGKAKKPALDESSEDSTDEPTNGNAQNGTTDEVKTKDKKASKGQKKTAATNGKAENSEEGQKKESSQTNNGTAAADSGKEKSKPVKAGGKKKQADVKDHADEPVASSEADSEPTPQEETKPKDKETNASGRGKKKTEAPKDEEVVAPKKAKKDPKPSKPVETEVNKETEEATKAAPAETKKAKGKGAKAKEVAIEHCKSWRVFGRNADRVKAMLLPFCTPSTAFSINKMAPRRGSFEIILVNENDEDKIIWSGIKRGPPRKEKFPSDEEVVELAEKFLTSSN